MSSLQSGGNRSDLDLEPLGEEPASTSPRMLVPLFLVPLLIVVVVVGIFLGFNSLVGRRDSVEDLVARIEGGGVNDRWQAAADLAGQVLRDPAVLDNVDLKERIRRVFAQSRDQRGSQLRRFLAEVMGQVEDREAVPLLRDALTQAIDVEQSGALTGDATEEIGAEIIHYSRALGRLADLSATEALLSLVEHPDKGFRMVTASALGSLYYPTVSAGGTTPETVTAALTKLHQDDESWVRMNSALALAKLGDEAGLPTLELMLDREYLKQQSLQFPDSGDHTVSNYDPALESMVYALVSIAAIASGSGDPIAFAERQRPLVTALEKVAADDPSDVVRERASEVLAVLRGVGAAENGA